MTFTISKDHTFSAAHVLTGLRHNHPCGRLHGHNYTLRITLTGDVLNADGFLLDYNDLRPFTAWVDDTLDHRHLNDVVDEQPSAENLSRWLAGVAADVLDLAPGVTVTVAVSETGKTWAAWTP